jgi:ubiquinone/menaquinone biosynthesis C-methylase UbiE
MSQLIIINSTKSDRRGNSVSPIENTQACEAIYDSMAPKYDEIAGSNTYHVPLWLKTQLIPYKDMHPTMLDCACATGNLSTVLDSIYLSPSFLFGIDISAEMVKAARTLKKYSAVIKWDLTNGLPFYRDNFFDFCIINGCLEFIEDPIQLLCSLFRVTGPGGLLLCTFEQTDNEVNRVIEMNIGPKNLRRFLRNKATVEQLLKTAGWSVEEVISNSGYVSPSTGKIIRYWYCRARKIL